MLTTLNAISPIDGRYRGKVEGLARFFSESALMKYRVRVEIEWFVFLCNDVKLGGTKVLSASEIKNLRDLYLKFDEKSAERVKEIEKTTNHDVKAIEYFIKEKMPSSLKSYSEFVHFGCTSEDINNLSYALSLKEFGDSEFYPVLDELIAVLKNMAKKYSGVAMLSHTHGQPASPTTVSKEFMNVVARLERQNCLLRSQEILGKMNGATGNFNAHTVAYPNIDWAKKSEKFVKSLGLVPNPYTTQIEPHDFIAEICDAVRRVNTILIDFDRDMWMYISMNYFAQKVVKGEVGSSAMPHKVNPIYFENSEGNLGVANALFGHFSEKLPISRMQRDLTDSTVLRNLGYTFALTILAYKSTLTALERVELNKKVVQQDLDNNWEVLAEAVQTVLRKNKVKGAYEKLKEFTRGQKINAEGYKKFVASLDLLKEDKKRLMELTPEKYIGKA